MYKSAFGRSGAEVYRKSRGSIPPGENEKLAPLAYRWKVEGSVPPGEYSVLRSASLKQEGGRDRAADYPMHSGRMSIPQAARGGRNPDFPSYLFDSID
jgi:hypothetical protein